MDPNIGPNMLKKQDEDEKPEKRDIKPVVKTLNRVPRACNACRKQKMRCEGADNPPCKRCRNTNLECLFEKPSREATLTGEAGLERIRSLEAHVAEIRHTQTTISNTLSELVSHLRAGAFAARSPSVYPQSFNQQSPSMSSPSMSTPTASHQHVNEMHPSPPGGQNTYPTSHQVIPPPRPSRGTIANQSYQSSAMPPPGQQTSPGDFHPPLVSPQYGANSQGPQPYNHGSAPPGPVLPPFSSLSTMGPPSTQQGNISSLRYQAPENTQSRPIPRNQASSSKRQAPPSSNVTSADSSDLEDEENGELPASGLVAPWEVLRGLADVAIERAAKENGDSSGTHSRARTPSPDRQSRPSKRRKIRHKTHRSLIFPDVVTKNIISEAEARELFDIFFSGCSTFLPVFDSHNDTFDALHERSPFAVDCICMVAARTRDGGAQTSETYRKILEEVQSISCATLFAPVMRTEAVQAMILVSGWSDNGWLSGGHAVRMAMELSMHKAWPKLLRRMKASKWDPNDDRELVIASRTWFCLYLFEHQLSYGTGRPAVLKDDDSIRDCRLLLQHPLAIEDDMRLVSTVELMALRERVNNAIPMEGPVKEEHFNRLREANEEFSTWYKIWDQAFSQKYEDAAFYRQSLQIQHLHAELFHNATALRGINGPDDVQNMPPSQRQLALRSIQIARQGLDITVNSPSYREGMKYAVHYTHATATFAASFLLRLARLFPNDCNMVEIRNQVERLANLMSEIPGKRYALTLQLMLKRSKKRKGSSSSRSPKTSREPHRPLAMVIDHPTGNMSGTGPVSHQRHQEPFSPQYDTPTFASSSDNPMQDGHVAVSGTPYHQQHSMQQHPQQQQQMYHQHYQHTADAEHIWRGFEATSNEQLPVWISDQSLGGTSFTQNGMDAFLLPNDYMPPAPQIW
ncbi:Transcriptional activator of proteases prtT [Hypsizygus marmoreus]|uniref:Transcriptional activator of proteases prtT n=1 Tax=Hypsizygus marmoreus TaxID=39966 RepID=A0A369KF52_HYPMA|nr:Transcriptional activator of proteases prtT [Hypsizygus marmoreus]